jgi:hypothetical protein
MEVPLSVIVVPTPKAAVAEVEIFVPGATRDKKEVELESDQMLSCGGSVVAPTLTAVEIQPGKLIASVFWLFPEAMIVAIPDDRKASI